MLRATPRDPTPSPQAQHLTYNQRTIPNPYNATNMPSLSPPTPTPFNAPRHGTGTTEWSDATFNIQRGCSHGCLYCYAAANASRFKLRDRSGWTTEELTAKAALQRFPSTGKVVMFPSAHDITANNLDAYTRIAKLILQNGNRLLIVSKPHYDCIASLVEDLYEYRDNILFRLSIGTMDPTTSAFWEPNAPTPAERISALTYAYTAGYATSVSAEPLLGGLDTAKVILSAVRPYITEDIWIGKVNRMRQRVDMSNNANAKAVADIERQQTDTAIMEMVDALSADPLVKWKDSIKKVIAARTKQGTSSRPLSNQG